MNADLVIAGGFREAAEFRAQESLPSRSIVAHRDGLSGRRPTRIHLLPDFFNKRDLPAWRAALRKLLRVSPKTQILVWNYGATGFTHVSDVRVDGLGAFMVAAADSTRPVPLPRVEKVDAVPDTELDGQIPIEEAIIASENEKRGGKDGAGDTTAPPTPAPEAAAVLDEPVTPADPFFEEPAPAKPPTKPRKPRKPKTEPEPASSDEDGFGEF